MVKNGNSPHKSGKYIDVNSAFSLRIYFLLHFSTESHFEKKTLANEHGKKCLMKYLSIMKIPALTLYNTWAADSRLQ